MPSPVRSHQNPAEDSTNWRRWALLGVVILALIVILQNSQQVKFKLLFLNTEAPLVLLLLVFTLIGAAIGYFGPMIRRGREKD
jgi:uncharacterized integral membrane protein